MLFTSAFLYILTLGGLWFVVAQTLHDSDGLVNLQTIVREVERTVPKIMPGFLGWGVPFLGSINYFGGVIDIPRLLVDRGYTVIITPIAPVSTNWEHACKLYRQLTFGQFSEINSATNFVDEVYDVDVDYGTYFAADPAHGPEQSIVMGRRRAILFSNSSAFSNWTWNRDHKVHFVCHSQGGNTVRYLLSLMANGPGALHPTYFSQAGRDDWTISVTTLGTPHRGTTFTNALENFLSQSRRQAISLVARVFAAASFYPPEKRAYDFQLDYWGIRRNPGEKFQDMLVRLESDNGPVWQWLNYTNNGFYDNSIEGVHNLSQRTISASTKVIYFSLSFDATRPFPEAWPAWGRDAIDSFPTSIESFARRLTERIPVIRGLATIIIDAITGAGWGILITVTSFRSFVEWLTQDVITRVIQELGYNLVLPKPGAYIPREDVIPVLVPSVYAMGGQELTPAQRNLLGPDLGDWFRNDGVVNTESMRGPHNSVRDISSLPDFNFSVAGKRGIYWHLGVIVQMDHADEVGVFIEQNTANLTQEMYLNIAALISRLPFS